MVTKDIDKEDERNAWRLAHRAIHYARYGRAEHRPAYLHSLRAWRAEAKRLRAERHLREIEAERALARCGVCGQTTAGMGGWHGGCPECDPSAW
jgi:hypothetical protein